MRKVCIKKRPLSAPGHERSKWLRDEKDVDWCDKVGKDNYYQQFSGGYGNSSAKEQNQERVYGNSLFEKNIPPKNASTRAVILKDVNFIGPPNEELIGLNIEARKRSRSSPSNTELMEVDGKLDSTNSEAVLSSVDCTGSSHIILAKSAEQTSHSL